MIDVATAALACPAERSANRFCVNSAVRLSGRANGPQDSRGRPKLNVCDFRHSLPRPLSLPKTKFPSSNGLPENGAIDAFQTSPIRGWPWSTMTL